jgi:hypothetical protein
MAESSRDMYVYENKISDGSALVVPTPSGIPSSEMKDAAN